jgi:hypothetical protein
MRDYLSGGMVSMEAWMKYGNKRSKEREEKMQKSRSE